MQHDTPDRSNASPTWSNIHSSAQWGAAAPARRAFGVLLEGAARYACPATGSVVLVSDPTTLAALTPPLSRLRCAACGEQHLLVLDETGGTAAP